MNRRWPVMVVVVLSIVASSLVQTPHANAKPRPKCLGKKATIVGNKKANTLKGTKKADVIVGLGGSDRIMGGGGADRICGGGGKDRIFGGNGNDRMDGGKGADECRQQKGTGPKKNCEGPKFQLGVSKAGSGSGTVTSSPPGIDCGLNCALTFVEGANVTLTATPSAASTFTGWAGACTGTGSCVVWMGKALSVVVTFTANPAPPPPVNDPPVANDDSASTNEDTPVTISVLANDSAGPADESGQTLTIDSVTQPADGSAANNGNGTVTYSPDSNFNGSDSFTYRACDNGSPSQCDNATVSITVGAVNDAPLANDDLAFTNEDSSTTVNVVANDSDPEGNLNVSSVTVTGGPFNGSVINNGNGTITYTPAANFFGTDSFSYQVCDTIGACDTATVTVTVASVNDDPVGTNDSASTDEDTSKTINVISNDSPGPANESGQTLSVNSASDPANGSTTNNGDGTVTYTPDANFHGTDTFTYEVCDNGTPSECDPTTTVTVTVASVNDPPVADDEAGGTNEDNSVVIDVLTGDSPGPPDESGQTLSVSSVTQPGNGSATNNGNGTVTYTPAANFNGTDSFTYQVCDSGPGAPCDTGTVTVTVNAANDPPVADDDIGTTNEDTSVIIDVLTGDSPGPPDESGQTLSVSSVTQPGNGSATNNGNGTVTYTPAANFNGTDSFTYQVCDSGPGAPCDTGTVTVTVSAVNDPPAVNDDSANTNEDTSVDISVLANDSDVEGLVPSSVTVTVLPSNGTAVDNPDGTVTYTPAANFPGPTDTFTYEVCDNGNPSPSLCDTGTVTVTVASVNDPPVADDEAGGTNEDNSVVIDVLTGDSPGPPDESGQTLSVSSVTQPGNGSATNNGNGTVTYTPAANFNGTDSFTYQVCDSGPGAPCDTGTVTVTVDAVNDPPVANNDSPSTNEDTLVDIPVLANDTDVEGLVPSSVTVIVLPSNGTAVDNPDGTVTYTPASNFNGTDTFTYEVCDNGNPSPSLCDTATVTVTVNSVNDAPVPDTDSGTTNEDTSVIIDVLAGDTPGPANESSQTISVSSVTQPADGTATNNGDGTVTYAPDANFNGTDTFTYQVCDNGSPSQCATGTVNVTVNAVNDPPVADDETENTGIGQPVTINVLAGDSPGPANESSQTLTVTPGSVTDPPNGSVVDHGDGTVTYTPDPLFIGIDTFTYEVCDNGTPSLCDNTGTVQVVVGV